MWKSLLFMSSRGKEKHKTELQHLINHPHPLEFHEEGSNQSKKDCSGCKGKVLGPCFGCVECRFYLHEKCAEAPVKIVHPFHRDHPLVLQLPSTHDEGAIYCKICWKKGKGFYYHCSSCEIYLDINCALLPRDYAGDFIENVHFDHQHPLILIANDNNHLQHRSCYGCSSVLTDALYACFDCWIFFHKRCVELPAKIDHPLHRKHQLSLDLEWNCLDCNVCKRLDWGYFYRCSHCKVDIHSICYETQSIIEDKDHHNHPFILQFRPNSFTCDACGDQGNNISYICTICNIQVHKQCTSLACIIRINLHRHLLYRNFFLGLPQDDSKTWDCKLCYQKVKLEHASYYCFEPDCNFIVHITCASENWEFYGVTELKSQAEVEEHNKELALLYNKSRDCITRVIEEIRDGEDVIATEIKHISHGHSLILSKENVDKKHCNGCVLPILSSFYYCSQCDFFLHKTCAELSSKKLLWFRCDYPLHKANVGIFEDKWVWYHHRPLTLITNDIFKCSFCNCECSGFSYKPNDDNFSGVAYCLRCATLPHSFTYPAHKPYHIFFDKKYKGQCSACGGSDGNFMWRTKDCDFALDLRCVTLPRTVWHKCDKHRLELAYEDDNDYLLHHYCDICEERRDPKLWFYRCKKCDTTVHPKCALGEYPFIKRGSYFTSKNHQHPLTLVQKIYDYPRCVICRKPCEDLSAECVEHGCNYIGHWKCVNPDDFGERSYFNSGSNDSLSRVGNDLLAMLNYFID